MRTARAVECVVMFIAAPMVLALLMKPGLLFPAIWALAVICLVVLLVDPTFDRCRLWNWRGLRVHLGVVIGCFLLGAAILTATLLLVDPDRLFQLPRRNPRLWAMIMVLYPVLSVYPQELAFRAFFFHRYEGVFGRGLWLVAASGIAFGLAHIVMWNWWAVGFSTVGGVLFAWTYLRTRSLAGAVIDHALYGCFLFTIGWGRYFYSGAAGG